MNPNPNIKPGIRIYLWVTVALAAMGLLALAIFAVFLFTRNLEIARKASRERMAHLSEYVVEYLEKDPFSYTLVLTPETLPKSVVEEKTAWLHRLASATGLERVALTDSSTLVYMSSAPTQKSGAPLALSKADSTCFEEAIHTGNAVYCQHQSRGITLLSLYHPFSFFGARHMVVLESDSNFIAYLEQYRAFILALSIFLACVLSGLLAALVLIDGKARDALASSRHNEQLAFLGRTSAELAHELKNPLAIIKSSVDVLRKQVDPERKMVAFNFLSDEVMRLSRLISNILGLSRDRPLDLRAFSPAELMPAITTAIQEIYPDIKLKIQIEKDLQGLGDRDAARQIVENLLRNGCQAMEGQGICHVIWRKQGKSVEALIGDEGPGISTALRKSIFDPFVTGSKTGTGLGLAIVRSLCERMEWQIDLLEEFQASNEVENIKVKTCFCLRIPLAKKPVGASISRPDSNPH